MRVICVKMSTFDPFKYRVFRSWASRCSLPQSYQIRFLWGKKRIFENLRDWLTFLWLMSFWQANLSQALSFWNLVSILVGWKLTGVAMAFGMIHLQCFTRSSMAAALYKGVITMSRIESQFLKQIISVLFYTICSPTYSTDLYDIYSSTSSFSDSSYITSSITYTSLGFFSTNLTLGLTQSSSFCSTISTFLRIAPISISIMIASPSRSQLTSSGTMSKAASKSTVSISLMAPRSSIKSDPLNSVSVSENRVGRVKHWELKTAEGISSFRLG